MDIASRDEAQRRADEIAVFRLELGRLERDRVLQLSDEQRGAVAAHHERLLTQFARNFDVDRNARTKQLSLGMRVVSFLGALALAASAFFLFYQFWGRFSTAVQVVILIASSTGSLVATVWIRRVDSSGYFTKLAAMVAFACFVLNIYMLGQIFNITPSDKALLPWAALAFLLAYSCDLRLLLAAGILCITAFIAARTGTWGGLYWLDFGDRPENFFPAAVALLAVPVLIAHQRFAGFAAIYRVFGLLTIFLPMLVLANVGGESYLPFDDETVEHFYQLLGFVSCVAAIHAGLRWHRPEVVNTGVTFFVVFLYTKFYDWWWETMPKYLFFMVLGLTALLFLFVLRRLRAGSSGLQQGASL